MSPEVVHGACIVRVPPFARALVRVNAERAVCVQKLKSVNKSTMLAAETWQASLRILASYLRIYDEDFLGPCCR